MNRHRTNVFSHREAAIHMDDSSVISRVSLNLIPTNQEKKSLKITRLMITEADIIIRNICMLGKQTEWGIELVDKIFFTE